MTDQLSKLHKLSAMKYDLAMSDLARHNQKIQSLEAQISDLRRRLFDIPKGGSPGDVPIAMSSGYFDKWQRWAEMQIMQLNISLARARADRESYLAQARVAFGRRSATEALKDRAALERRVRVAKALEQSASSN